MISSLNLVTRESYFFWLAYKMIFSPPSANKHTKCALGANGGQPLLDRMPGLAR